jgi:hypothetical protein
MKNRLSFLLTGAGAALLLVLTACAPAATTGSGQNSNVLTRDEIMAVEVSTLYDVVQRLRPRWLASRGPRSFGDAGLRTEIVVFQGQTLLGDVEVLRQFSPNMAARLRYMDGATASASLPGLGSRHVEGAIIIDTSTN